MMHVIIIIGYNKNLAFLLCCTCLPLTRSRLSVDKCVNVLGNLLLAGRRHLETRLLMGLRQLEVKPDSDPPLTNN